MSVDTPGATAPDYGFARRPKWLLSHALVGSLIAAMIAAGIWQIQRHYERADQNERVETLAAQQPVPVHTVVSPSDGPAVGEQQQFRRVLVRGEYQLDDEVLIRNRTLEGAPGWWVITPLLTDEGWAVAVNRGWIPLLYEADEPRPGTEPPDGIVEITGTIHPTRTAEGFQVADPAEGRLSSLARPDVERLASQLDYPVAPMVVRLAPDDASLAAGPDGEINPGQPTPLALPALDGGPHLSYAAQWFIFTTIAVVGYPLILRRVARGSASSHDPGTEAGTV